MIIAFLVYAYGWIFDSAVALQKALRGSNYGSVIAFLIIAYE
jgi:hypothetical protein